MHRQLKKQKKMSTCLRNGLEDHTRNITLYKLYDTLAENILCGSGCPISEAEEDIQRQMAKMLGEQKNFHVQSCKV